MPTFSIASGYTLFDVLKSYDPQNKLHHLIDAFADKRPILEEAFWQEANGDTYHEMMRIVSKPTGAFMAFNEGYAKEGVETVPVKEQLAMIGSRFEIDKRLMEVQRDPKAWRAQRAQAHIRGMIENWDLKFWRGNVATSSKEVNGILTRNTPASLAAITANQKALGGTTNLYPVAIVKWGMDEVSLLYPKFGANTFEEDDRGLVDLQDANGNPFPGYRSYFNFRYGIAQGKDVSVQRLINVDATAIKGGSTFEEALIELLNNYQSLEGVAIYCGKQIMTGIQQRLNSKSNLYFTVENVWGRMMPTFQGVPIIKDDALSTTESQIS